MDKPWIATLFGNCLGGGLELPLACHLRLAAYDGAKIGLPELPKPYPKEFRDDVVAVARKVQAPLSQIAKDFGISEGCLHNWLKNTDIDDGRRDGPTGAERVQLRELKKRNRLLEQENEVLRRAAAYLSQANLPGK